MIFTFYLLFVQPFWNYIWKDKDFKENWRSFWPQNSWDDQRYTQITKSVIIGAYLILEIIICTTIEVGHGPSTIVTILMLPESLAFMACLLNLIAWIGVAALAVFALPIKAFAEFLDKGDEKIKNKKR